MIKRSDRRPVIFVEVKKETKEQSQQTKPQSNLNLCEILKDCPKGTELWSDNYGIVKFVSVCTEWDTPIEVLLSDGQSAYYTEEGWQDKRFPASCLLYPSKDCRDWSKFSAPWCKKDKKDKFDPKTLKPFDKVIVRTAYVLHWSCDLFSFNYIGFNGDNKSVCIGDNYSYCIPYNDETKHLIGTTKEAPDFYRYWED